MAKRKKTVGPKAKSAQTAKPKPPAFSFGSLLVALLGGTIAFYLVFGWVLPAPILLAPVVAGVFVGVVMKERVPSAIVGGAVGLLGSLTSLSAYTTTAYVKAVNGAPAWANPDVPASLYTQTLYQHILASPVNSKSAAPFVFVLGVVVTAAVAYGVAMLAREDLARVRRLVVGGVAALLALCFVFTVVTTGASFLTNVSTQPASGTYAFDPVIYMNTYYEMLHGHGYYQSLVLAAAGDSRLQKDSLVHRGKFYGWVLSASFIRQPNVFYLWKYASPHDARGVVYLGAVLCALLLFGAWWALEPWVGDAALLAPAVLAPYLLLMTVDFNIFFPDYWAALMVLGSILLLLRRQFIAAIAIAFLAACFRETTVPWLVILAGYSAFLWIRDRSRREWLVRGSVALALIVLFAAQLALHLHNGSAVIAPGMHQQSAFSYYFSNRMLSGLQWKLVEPSAYMMFPYGYFSFPGWLLWPFALLGMWVALMKAPHVRMLVLLFLAFWIVFCLILGVSSSYWGQGFMPATLLATAMLIAAGDRLPAAFART